MSDDVDEIVNVFKLILACFFVLTVIVFFIPIPDLFWICVWWLFCVYVLGGWIFASDEMQYNDGYKFKRQWIWCFVFWPLFGGVD